MKANTKARQTQATPAPPPPAPGMTRENPITLSNDQIAQLATQVAEARATNTAKRLYNIERQLVEMNYYLRVIAEGVPGFDGKVVERAIGEAIGKVK